MMRKIDDTVATDFLLTPCYRRGRHLLLQFVMVLITVNVFWHEPLQSLSLWQRLLGWGVYLLMMDVVIYTNLFLLIPRFLLENRFGIYLLAASGVVFMTTAFTVVLQNILYAPGLPGLYPGSFAILIHAFSGVITIGFLTAGMAAIMLFRHWIFCNQRIDELKSTTLHTEFKYLKNQVNPHFLFNMLENANVLIEKNPAEASGVLFKLEDLMRYQIDGSSRGYVSLRSDLDFLNDYLSLEKLRRDKFEYTLILEGEADAVRTPPLLFMPFVENAVKHSFDRINPSYIYLTIIVSEKQLDLRCEHSKPPVAAGKKREIGGSGLANIRRRLALLYPGRYLLGREETEEKYIVTLHLEL